MANESTQGDASKWHTIYLNDTRAVVSYTRKLGDMSKSGGKYPHFENFSPLTTLQFGSWVEKWGGHVPLEITAWMTLKLSDWDGRRNPTQALKVESNYPPLAFVWKAEKKQTHYLLMVGWMFCPPLSKSIKNRDNQN